MQLSKYLSLIKFSHTVFAMPFALLGFTIGLYSLSSSPEAHQINLLLFLVVVCMVTARSAAMAFNRYIDRYFDALNPRTAIREIPAGVIKPQNALFFVVFNCVGFLVASYLINPLCFALAPVALLVIIGYSYTKRFTPLCHVVLGIGLGLAPLGAYLAINPNWDIVPILLGLSVLFWVSGFDVIYALQDEEFDRANKLKSIPVLLGRLRALQLARILHLNSILIIWYLAFLLNASWLYYLAAAIYSLLLIRQHSLVSPNDLSRVNLAFFTFNGIASLVFCSLAILDIVLFKF